MPNLNFNTFNIPFLKRGADLWSELTGTSSMFPLERRIFHSISLSLIIICCVYVPYNLYAGLYVASLSALSFGLFFFYQYYYSRFKDRPHSNLIFGTAGILVFGINYFANSGIHGSTDLIWPAYLLLVFAISPYQQHIKWLVVYLLCFFWLHLVEYQYPELVKYPFIAGKGQFIDRITAFLLPVLVLYVVIRFIRRSHDTEREVVRIQKDRLEQSNTEKNKLMSIISHDLRAPLMNVQGYLELLMDHELDSSERPELEKALLKSTNSAMDMLSNLLHWSKSQMEGLIVNLVEVNLMSVLLSTLEMERMHAQKKDISLDYHIPLGLKVIADIDMLQLVVRNLISNAVKFTPPGGFIHIDAHPVSGACKITVRDNGNGISKENQEKIFSIKSQPSYGTQNEKGVGLGLVLCKEFIERQQGRIGFESTPGLGSSFFVFVPLATN